MASAIPPDFQHFVEQEIARGKYQTAEQVITEGLRLLKERESHRQRLRQDIQAGMEADSVPGAVVLRKLEKRARDIASRDHGSS